MMPLLRYGLSIAVNRAVGWARSHRAHAGYAAWAEKPAHPTGLFRRSHRQCAHPALLQFRGVRHHEPAVQIVQNQVCQRVYPVVALVEAGDVVVLAAARVLEILFAFLCDLTKYLMRSLPPVTLSNLSY